MSGPLNPEREQRIRYAVAAYTEGHSDRGFVCCSAHGAADGARELLAELDRLRDDLAEMTRLRDQARRDAAHWQHELQLADQRITELRDELAETKALHNPRLRGLLVKTAKDQDQYVHWSTVADGPKGVYSRETALEAGFPRTHLDRADETGTSAVSGEGAWGDTGFVADQRWLRRHLIGGYAIEYLHGDHIAAYALLEPIDHESEATR